MFARALTLLIAVACSSSPLETEHVAPSNGESCVGLSRHAIEPGSCVRIVPMQAGPAVAYGPACDALLRRGTSLEPCVAWVIEADQVIWVNDTTMSLEIETNSADCSCD